MSVQQNPIVPAGGFASWLNTWITAVTKPNEQTYVDLAERPEAKANKAYLWVFIAGTLGTLVAGLLQALVLAMGFGQGGTQLFGQMAGGSIVSVICAAPIAGGVSVLGFMIGTGVTQWVAKLFGGTGTFNKLAYVMGAISVPITLVSSIITPFSVITYLGIVIGLLSFALGCYAIYLEVLAVKAVNQFSWGKAIGSVILPALVIGLLCACIVVVVLLLLGPAIGNVFSQVQQGLGGY